jgi:sugar phosphate permease
MLTRLPDYVRCFALMAIAAVTTTMAIIFRRTATNAVQSSLYVVYLKGVGLSGTLTGILFAAIAITSGLGSLCAGRAMQLGNPQRTMLSGIVLSILLIRMTPFTNGIFALLFAAQALRGWLHGVVQPMMFSMRAKTVGPRRQGSVVSAATDHEPTPAGSAPNPASRWRSTLAASRPREAGRGTRRP